jgi:hypothetical protein
MMKLTQNNFARARAYMEQHGRPLEQSLFRWVFDSGSTAAVYDELAKHQASNGGFFGMGEGPNDAPSPMGSTVAFQYLTDIRAPASYVIVQRGIQYFIDTYDHEYEGWPQTIPDDGYLEKDLHWCWGNPGGEILGYLWCYRELVPREFLTHVTDVAMTHFRGITSHVSTFCDICFLRCARSIDPQYKDEIIQKLIETVSHHNLERDHAKWETGYFVKPYWYAMTPASPLHPVLKDEIEYCLDFDIRTQAADGSAYLTFNVTGQDQVIWKSVWTLESLRVLKAYGRIEGVSS